jgi:hypothetical protein
MSSVNPRGKLEACLVLNFWKNVGLWDWVKASSHRIPGKKLEIF